MFITLSTDLQYVDWASAVRFASGRRLRPWEPAQTLRSNCHFGGLSVSVWLQRSKTHSLIVQVLPRTEIRCRSDGRTACCCRRPRRRGPRPGSDRSSANTPRWRPSNGRPHQLHVISKRGRRNSARRELRRPAGSNAGRGRHNLILRICHRQRTSNPARTAENMPDSSGIARHYRRRRPKLRPRNGPGNHDRFIAKPVVAVGFSGPTSGLVSFLISPQHSSRHAAVIPDLVAVLAGPRADSGGFTGPAVQRGPC